MVLHKHIPSTRSVFLHPNFWIMTLVIGRKHPWPKLPVLETNPNAKACFLLPCGNCLPIEARITGKLFPPAAPPTMIPIATMNKGPREAVQKWRISTPTPYTMQLVKMTLPKPIRLSAKKTMNGWLRPQNNCNNAAAMENVLRSAHIKKLVNAWSSFEINDQYNTCPIHSQWWLESVINQRIVEHQKTTTV